MNIQKLEAYLQVLKSVGESIPCTFTLMELGERHDLATPVYQVCVSFVCEEDGWKKFYSASVLFYGDGKAYANMVTHSANPEEGICANKIDKAWLEEIGPGQLEEGEVCEEDGSLTWFGGYTFLLTAVFMSLCDSPDKVAELESRMDEELQRVQAKL